MDMSNERHGKIDKAARNAAGVHDLPGKKEERHGEKRIAVCAVDHIFGDNLSVEHAQLPHEHGAGNQQRECDRDAERHGPEERADEDRYRHRLSASLGGVS